MECVNPYLKIQGIKRYMLPCGKCLVCLQSKRNDWAFRVGQEFKAAKNGALFVTLTYSHSNLPRYGSLEKTDLQKFFKRLRKREAHNNIRYYAVGEYGSRGHRPHYHALIFNANERSIRESWPLGLVHVGTVTPASVAYVLKYIVQPEVAPSGQVYDEVTEQWREKFVRPFALMSRAYGIGAAYLTEQMVEWHRSGGKNYVLVPGTTTKSRLPRYYKDIIWPKRYLPFKTEKVGGKTIYTTEMEGYTLAGRIPLSDVEFTERERVFNKSSLEGRRAVREERRFYWKTYGKEAKAKYTEHRNAVLARIKTKVAYTQTF